MKLLKRLLEVTLWSSRLVVLMAVVFGIVLALGAFYLATTDVFYTLRYLVSTQILPWEPENTKA